MSMLDRAHVRQATKAAGVSIATVSAILLGTSRAHAADEMALHWRFDSPYEFGAIEADASGRSVDGISTWARIRAGGGVRYAPGQGVFGGAGLLGGSEPGALHGVRGSMRSLTSMELGEEWSVSLWVKPCQDKNRYYDILSFVQKRDGVWESVFSLGQHGPLRASFNLDGKNALYQFHDRETKLPAGQWSHLLFVCGKEEMGFYLNGKKAGQSAKTRWDPKAGFFVRLSGRNGGPHNRLYGLYDDLRIYSGALSPEHVAQLARPQSDFYRNEKTPPIADAGLGYTAWLKKGGWLRSDRASFNMQGGVLFPGRNGGGTAYRWEVVKQPIGAKGTFADPSDPETTFTTNRAGPYEFRLSARNAAGSDTALAKGAVFIRDRGPKEPKLFARNPEDAILLNHVEPPHPQRAAALTGKTLRPVAHWTFDKVEAGTAIATGSSPRDMKVDPDLAAFTEKGRYGGGLKVSSKRRGQVLDFGEFADLTSEFTLSFWLHHDSALGRGTIFQALGDDNKHYWKLYYRGVDKVTGHSNLIYKWYKAGGQAPTNVHYAITYSKLGDINKFFINGEHAAFLKRPLEKATGVPRLVFGVNGILDDVALYDTTLNIDEVWSLYNSQTGAAGLTARIPVDPYMSRGYRTDFMKRYMPEPVFEYQNEGFAAERFGKTPPPAYTHPRLNFGLKDLPRIRRLTRTTEQGHSNFAYITLYPRTLFGENLEDYSPNIYFPEVRDAPGGANRDKLQRELEEKLEADPERFTMKQLPRGDGGEQAAARGMLAYKALLTADGQLARMLIGNMMRSAELQKRALDVANKRTAD
ncbi:MAG: LamG domain-containing protein, partial [Planctomycetota bacterium]